MGETPKNAHQVGHCCSQVTQNAWEGFNANLRPLSYIAIIPFLNNVLTCVLDCLFAFHACSLRMRESLQSRLTCTWEFHINLCSKFPLSPAFISLKNEKDIQALLRRFVFNVHLDHLPN